MKIHELDSLRECLEQFLAITLFPACTRSQQRHWGDVYVRGLLLDGERKSVGAMALRMPDGNEQAMQQFVSQSTWDYLEVRKRLAQYMEALLPADSAWLIDETSFPKKGDHSVGVARQYCGAKGRPANCQVAVSLHLASTTMSLPLDFELVIPESWSADPDRCGKAGIPEELRTHLEKWRLAIALIDRLRRWQLEDRVVTADGDYGRVTEFRDALIARTLKYVVAIEEKMVFWPADVSLAPRPYPGRGRRPTRPDLKDKWSRPADFARSLQAEDWTIVTWRDGTKGPLRSRFAAVRVRSAHGFSRGDAVRDAEWLLIEWPEGAEAPTRFWLSNLPEDTPLERLVDYAKRRWFIEDDYRRLKEELGLDHFEGRSWLGWNRHVTLAMLAFAFLLTERARRLKKGLQMTLR
ncbi:MAG: putative family ISAzvi8-like transposase [Firmicutes bacterium]|nr:putative family ISAzvi8-like transposase [Bacillota bacterium]